MLPNFLIIGAAKAGSTSLYRYIGQHPDVFMSASKEPDFFVWVEKEVDVRGPEADKVKGRIVADVVDYQELFRGATQEGAVGEASTAYLYTPEAPRHIRDYIPEAKLLAILRNPIDRAYSAFLHARRAGYEPLSDFGDALKAEPERINEQWGGLTHYVRVGMYAQQLDRYLAFFPAEQIRVYLYDDLVRDPVRVAQNAYRFLGVEPSFEPSIMQPQNKGMSLRSRRFHELLNSERVRSVARRLIPSKSRASLYFSMRDRNTLPIASIPPAIRTELARVYESEIEALSVLIGRDLSPWLEAQRVKEPERDVALGMQPVPSH